MELPEELKTLYRHWPEHAIQNRGRLQVSEVFHDDRLLEQMLIFVQKRMLIWDAKYKGRSAPYTDDQILSTYRFCNIFRELDKQTIEFHTLLNPLRDNFPLWLLNMFYGRLVARPETVRAVGLLSFDSVENEKLYERLMKSQRPRYGTPYVFPVSTILRSATPTREMFIARYLMTVMSKVAGEISRWDKLSVVEGVQRVLPLFGFNLEFLWTEVLIDVAYQYPKYIDLYKPFPVGPGSLPTFKRINPDVQPMELAEKLGLLGIDAGLTYEQKPLLLSAENWEGIGCEFRKYTNLAAGRGRKRLYKS